MARLLVSYAVPNPAGRDRTPANTITRQQLNSEWVQFVAPAAASIQGVGLFHRTFNDQCQLAGEDPLTNFVGSLGAGQAIRVHSGWGANTWDGNVLHVFLNRGNFVWNNRCGDAAILRESTGTLIDWAAYDPRPSEGVLLQRQVNSNRLIPAARATGTMGW